MRGSLVRCLKLPTVLSPRTVYLVPAANNGLEIYVTGNTAEVVKHALTAAEVIALIANSPSKNGVQFLASLPTPSLVTVGMIACYTADSNKLVYCDGTKWTDLLKVNSGGSSSTIDDKLLRRLRNANDFGINIT